MRGGRAVQEELGGVAGRLRGKNVHIVETEQCDAGIAGIPTWLGLKEKFSPAVMIHGGNFPHHLDTVTKSGRKRLEKYLAHEYALQDELRKYAAEQKRHLGGGRGGGAGAGGRP